MNEYNRKMAHPDGQGLCGELEIGIVYWAFAVRKMRMQFSSPMITLCLTMRRRRRRLSHHS